MRDVSSGRERRGPAEKRADPEPTSNEGKRETTTTGKHEACRPEDDARALLKRSLLH